MQRLGKCSDLILRVGKNPFMVGLLAHTAYSIRLAAVIAVAIGLALPAPARFASCPSDHSCSLPGANSIAGKLAAASCCSKHATNAPAASACAHSQNCGCELERTDPTAVGGDRQSPLHPSLESSTAAAIFFLPPSNVAPLEVKSIADSIPSIPHRILHCSWLI
jgi:hypothetical protein